jgi:hypothetical protein
MSRIGLGGSSGEAHVAAGHPRAAACGQPAAGIGADDGHGGAGGNAFATVAIGEAGAKNAALLAVSILALTDARLHEAWLAFRAEQTALVMNQGPLAGGATVSP